MKPLRAALALALTGAIAAGAVSLQPLQAQDKKEYVAANILSQVKLVELPLPGVKDKTTHIERIAFPPGWVGGKHYHAGPVYVYILKGDFSVDEGGKPRQTFKAGDLYMEPLRTPMQARVASTRNRVKSS